MQEGRRLWNRDKSPWVNSFNASMCAESLISCVLVSNLQGVTLSTGQQSQCWRWKVWQPKHPKVCFHIKVREALLFSSQREYLLHVSFNLWRSLSWQAVQVSLIIKHSYLRGNLLIYRASSRLKGTEQIWIELWALKKNSASFLSPSLSPSLPPSLSKAEQNHLEKMIPETLNPLNYFTSLVPDLMPVATVPIIIVICLLFLIWNHEETSSIPGKVTPWYRLTAAKVFLEFFKFKWEGNAE